MFTRFLLVATAVALLAACSSRDVKKDLEIVDATTGWYDLGVLKNGPDIGKTKLVPSIAIRLKNRSLEGISGVELDAVFRFSKDQKHISDHYLKGVPSNVLLAAGAVTPPIVVRGDTGHVGTETRTLMLQNSLFKDAEVTILLRHGRNNWVRINVFPIERKLMTQ